MIRLFIVEIFAKWYWRFFNPYFSMYFHKYSKYKPTNISICENCIKPVQIFGNHLSKCPDIKRKRRPISLHRVLPGRSSTVQHYFSSVGSPWIQVLSDSLQFVHSLQLHSPHVDLLSSLFFHHWLWVFGLFSFYWIYLSPHYGGKLG